MAKSDRPRRIELTGGLARGTAGVAGAVTAVSPTAAEAFYGSNVASAPSSRFASLSVAQVYDGEPRNAGDLIIGKRSAGHILWDNLAEQLQFRENTTVRAYVGTDGRIHAGAGRVILDEAGALLRPRHRVDDPTIPTWSTVRWRHAASSFDAAAIGAQVGSVSQPELNLTAYNNDGTVGATIALLAGNQVVVTGLSAVALGAGSSASAPHVALPGDLNTGVFWPAADALAVSAGGTERQRWNATGIGFFGATPVAKPTVTGSRAGNAALASVLTALATLGLITDASS